ncbi:hypothetical protein [Roseobacter sp.]|uniref:hypothetical protein n=1 Tax=Roseobacter sp. TaxID=1907202 RepID=UPI003298E629
MLDNPSMGQVVAALEHGLALGHWPQAVRSQAEGLRDRLRRRVRIVVLGPQGVGKSHLCHLMVGRAPVDGAGEMSVCYADPAYDPTLDVAAHMQVVPVLAGLLTSATLTDSHLPADALSAQPDVHTAIEHADIVLWCTHDFGPVEAALWARTPEYIKDHSVLVVTKVDRWMTGGQLHQKLAALQDVAAQEFHSVFPVSMCHAHKSLCEHHAVEDEDLAISGVKALRLTVSHLVASGQQADKDSAVALLQRYGAERPAPVDAPAPHAQTYREALSLVQARTPDFATLMEGPELPAQVLSVCGAIAEDLAELAAAHADGDADFDIWRNDLYEASDKVILMGLENDPRSAADGVAVILQLRQDLERRVAR